MAACWNCIRASRRGNAFSTAIESANPFQEKACFVENFPCTINLPTFLTLGTTMLRILGAQKRFCDGLTRRDMLWAGGLGMFGLGLDDYFRLAETRAATTTSTPRSFGKAKSCIL